MSKKEDEAEAAAQAIVQTLAPMGRDLIQGVMGILQSLAQAAANSPVIATAATVIIADFLQKFKIITPGGSAIAMIAVTGLSVAEETGKIIGAVIPLKESSTTTGSIAYDIQKVQI